METARKRRGPVRVQNRWEHFREKTVFQITALEREHVLPFDVAERLREAFYEADATLVQSALAMGERFCHA